MATRKFVIVGVSALFAMSAGDITFGLGKGLDTVGTPRRVTHGTPSEAREQALRSNRPVLTGRDTRSAPPRIPGSDALEAGPIDGRDPASSSM